MTAAADMARHVSARVAVCIYALCDPDGCVRYVGKATEPARRFRQHLNDKTESRRGRWIRNLLAGGERPRLLMLQWTENNWQDAERRWIRVYAGPSLTNHTEGGEGLSGASEETRGKLAAIMAARLSDPVMKAHIYTAERSAKISRSSKGRKLSAAHVRKLPQNRKGYKRSAEAIAKVAAAMRGKKYPNRPPRPFSAEARARAVARMIGNKQTLGRVMPEHERLQRSIANRGKAKDAGHRAKIGAALKAAWARRKAKATEVPT